MTLLVDFEIEELLTANPSLIDGFDPNLAGALSIVKGASLDLSIGAIFVPGAKRTKLGGVDRPRTKLSLKTGQTAVLRSAEKLRMPKNVAGIGFPPSSKVSLAGLLTTNPGHIDPDYSGHVHLTVVNMGKEDFPLARGDRLMRLMLFKLSKDARRIVGELPSPVTDELLAGLSHDFLDIDTRAKRAAKSEELRLRSFQVWGSIAATVLAGFVAYVLLINSGQRELSAQVSKIEGRMNSLGGSLSVVSFEEQAKKVGALEERLRLLESQAIPSGAKRTK